MIPFFLIIRAVIGPQRPLSISAAELDTTSQRPGPQTDVATSRQCKTAQRIRGRLAVIRAASWGRCGVAQLREGHLGARQRCFTKDILTSLEPPTLTCVFSFIHPALPLPPPPPPPPRSPPCSSPNCLSAHPARPTPSRSPTVTAVVTRFSQESQPNAGLEELHRPPPGAPDAASLQPVLS